MECIRPVNAEEADEAATPKVGALLRVRLSSSRLSDKALKLIEGRPAVAHILDRIFQSRYVRAPEDVLVCITDHPSDDALVPAVEATGAKVFRGSNEDLISRLAGAVARHPSDIVIQVDGDDICVEPLYMDLCVEALLSSESADICVCDGLPLGIASKAIRVEAIRHVASRYVPGPNATGGMLYFTHTGLCNVATASPASPTHVHDTARITLDYEQDLRFFRAVFAELYRPGEVFTIDPLMALLRRRPALVAINADLSRRYWRRSDALINAEQLRYRASNGDLETIRIIDEASPETRRGYTPATAGQRGA
jgi:spore coat polysaccharide biosynthesis protein SpsF